MIRSLGRGLSHFAHRWVPDPFAIALLLTLCTIALAAIGSEAGLMETVGYWGGRLKGDELLGKESGFWKLLTFAMQMCLILVTGHALASSRPISRLVERLAALPRSQSHAVALTASVAMIFAWLNWGLGLIVGALLAREVARASKQRGLRVHYPLLGAAGYTGLLVWHGGLSGSAPLKITQTKDLAEILGRTDITPVTLTDTIFSPMNLVVFGALLVAVPLLLNAMAPAEDEILEITDEQAGAGPIVEPPPSEPTPAQRLEQSPLLVWLIAAVAALYLVRYIGKIGVSRVDLNAINLTFLTAGLVLQGSARAYGQAISDGVQGCAGIILQFPFYAGIMGLMALSGLVTSLATATSSFATEATFAPLTMLSAGIVNLFVPSGGGQWAVQGPLVVQSAETLGVPLGKAVMAFAYGDAWTNMLQPFWALPLLGITRLEAREIVGYTAALMLLIVPIYLIAFALF